MLQALSGRARVVRTALRRGPVGAAGRGARALLLDVRAVRGAQRAAAGAGGGLPRVRARRAPGRGARALRARAARVGRRRRGPRGQSGHAGGGRGGTRGRSCLRGRLLPLPTHTRGQISIARTVRIGTGIAQIPLFISGIPQDDSKKTSVCRCAVLLGCAALCHLSAIASALRPAPLPCAAVRLAAPALAGVYACVLARTVRIARLVAAAERAQRPTRWLSSRAQLGAWVALSAPGVAVASWAALRWAPMPRVLHPVRVRSVLACGGEHALAHLLPLSPALVLLAACVALAIRTRRLPHNFNETRFIGSFALVLIHKNHTK